MFSIRRPCTWADSPLFTLLVNLILALLIYSSAELGRAYGIPGPSLRISVIWPPTGFSLAALLLFGYQVWPGILLGNWINNLLYFLVPLPLSPIYALLMSLAISAGSLLQALVGGFLIKRYSNPPYLNRAKDVLFFLGFGGILTCLIASTWGVSLLYLQGSIPYDRILEYWLTFWMGDTFGVLVICPLILVWTLIPRLFTLKERWLEIVTMSLVFGFLAYLSVWAKYPVTQFYIPLCIWAAYRFQIHGATLATSLTVLLLVSITSMGYGWIALAIPDYTLLILISFLSIVLAVGLILSGLVNEKELAWRYILKENMELQENIDLEAAKIAQLREEVIFKDALATLGIIAAGVAEKMKEPLESMKTTRENTRGALEELTQLLTSHQDNLPNDFLASIENLSQQIAADSAAAGAAQTASLKLIAYFKELAEKFNPKGLKIKWINLHTLITQCIEEVAAKKAIEYPALKVLIKKNGHWTKPMIPGLPEELAGLFKLLLGFAFDSMQAKQSRLGDDYTPHLFIQIQEDHQMVVLKISIDEETREIEDSLSNGPSQFEQELLFQIPLLKHLISSLHRGQMRCESILGQTLKVTIKLPRNLYL